MINKTDYLYALNFIQSKKSLGIKPGLDRIKKMLNKADNPQNNFKIIHIAGTNGKGTVAATLSKALIDNGYKTGLFTSPWVVDYREQIQINNEYISEGDFAQLAKEVETLGVSCTEFEALTYMAYSCFYKNKVDYAVIECGMGGLGDATNVEEYNLSVITPISLDHTDYFGNTLEDIAKEKSGILRSNCDCIIYSDELKAVFEPKCRNLIISENKDNLCIVNSVLKYIGLASVNSLVRLPARQERLGGVLFDGGHNVASARELSKNINNETAVIAMMKDKDIDGYLSIIAPKCKRIIATEIDNKRCISANELASVAKKYCGDVEVISDPKKAVTQKGITLVCGSFYFIREVRNIFI